jgi:hypothetical protein
MPGSAPAVRTAKAPVLRAPAGCRRRVARLSNGTAVQQVGSSGREARALSRDRPRFAVLRAGDPRSCSAYRIAQEGLTNVLKHANASEAVVSLRYAPAELSIEAQDNGQGMTPGNGHHPGHGHIGIRERVRLYDGELTTSPNEGGGFLLRVRLPLSRQPR